jgi:hypothetical protein
MGPGVLPSYFSLQHTNQIHPIQVPYAVAGSSLPCQPSITLEQRNVLKQQLPKPVSGGEEGAPLLHFFLVSLATTTPRNDIHTTDNKQVGYAIVKLWTLAVKGKGGLGDVAECLETQVAPALDVLYRRLDKKREKALVSGDLSPCIDGGERDPG